METYNIVKKDFNFKYTFVNLSNKPDYSTKFNFRSNQISMLCGYNTRNKMRWILLEDRYGNVILPQTFMKNKKRCELNFNANQIDLHYYVTLKIKDTSSLKNTNDTYDYLNWANDFELCFVGYTQDVRNTLDDNYRKVMVGN